MKACFQRGLALRGMWEHFKKFCNLSVFILIFSYSQLQGQEGPNIAKCFKSKDFTLFQSSGVFAEGVKYNFLRQEDGKVVYAKKKDCGAITLQASKSAIVIAHMPEGGQQGNVNKGVAVIAEYLESLGM